MTLQISILIWHLSSLDIAVVTRLSEFHHVIFNVFWVGCENLDVAIILNLIRRLWFYLIVVNWKRKKKKGLYQEETEIETVDKFSY